jgi:hypothetical protein
MAEPLAGDGRRSPLARLADMAGRRLWVLVACVVLMLAGGAALLALRGGDDSPTEVLETVQRSVAGHDTVRFDLRGRVESEEEEGESYVTRLRAKGEAVFPDRFRLVDGIEEYFTEVIGVGDTFYLRAAEEEDELGKEKWARFDLSEEKAREGVTRLPGGPAVGFDEFDPEALAFEQFGQPPDIPRIVKAAHHPVVERRYEDATVLRGELRIDDAFVHGGDQLDEATVELTVTEDGQLERLLLRFSGDPGNGRLDYHLSGWGEAVRVEPPPSHEIDPTPEIDEEAVANFKDTPLVQPRAIPEGWEQTFATVLEEDETEEECRQVEVDYEDPEDPDSGYLYMYELPGSCADLEPPRRSRPFRAGPNSGWIDDDEEEAVSAQLVVGTTVLQIETDLDPDVLAAVLSQLVPLDVAKPPPGQPGLTRRSGT